MADRDEEDRRLLGNIVTELGHIKEKLTNTNLKLDTIATGQKDTNAKLDQLIKLLTPAPGDDVASLAVTVDKPINQ